MSAADVRRWSRDVQRFAEQAPGEVIDIVDRAVTDRLRADTGGDGGFSGGPRLGRATTSVTRRKAEAVVEASGSPAIWRILESGAKPHKIVGKRKLLLTPEGPRRRVNHPGAPAKRTWQKGAERGRAEAKRELSARWQQIAG